MTVEENFELVIVRSSAEVPIHPELRCLFYRIKTHEKMAAYVTPIPTFAQWGSTG